MLADTYYAVTLPQCKSTYSHLEATIVSLDIDSYVIARELHEDGNYHFHCAIKLGKNYDLVHIRQFCTNVLPEGAAIDVQACKKSRDWLRYCTKEDKHAIVVNIKEENINAYWKIWSCVFKSPDLTLDHPYIMRNVRYTNVFKTLHAEHWGRVEVTQYLEKKSRFVVDESQQIVAKLTSAYDAGHNLYIYGPTGIGKSVFAKSLIVGSSPDHLLQLSTDDRDNFLFGGISGTTRLVYHPDCSDSFAALHRSSILVLGDKGLFRVNPKFQVQLTLQDSYYWLVIMPYQGIRGSSEALQDL